MGDEEIRRRLEYKAGGMLGSILGNPMMGTSMKSDEPIPFDKVRPIFVDSLPLSEKEILTAEIDQLAGELKERAGEWAHFEHLNMARHNELVTRDRIEFNNREGKTYFRYVYPEVVPKAKRTVVYLWDHYYWILAAIAWVALFALIATDSFK
jgi:hypothetical protein